MSQSTIVVAESTTSETPAAAETQAGGETTTGAGETGHSEGTAAEGGHKGAFPPMDATTFPSQIFWLVIFFALLYLLMSRLVLPRLAQILHGRAAKIGGDLAKAQALKDETEAAIKAYEKSFADARAKATSIAQETRTRLATEMDAERGQLEETLARKLGAAEAQIAKMRKSAMADVDAVAADTAAEIVAQLTGTKLAKAAVDKAVADVTKG